jgi:hypothetical protein
VNASLNVSNTLLSLEGSTPDYDNISGTWSTPNSSGTFTGQRAQAEVSLSWDVDGDRHVSVTDVFGVMRAFGPSTCGNPADTDGDCVVSSLDLFAVMAHFSEATP